MRPTERLFRIIQILRHRRRPITGRALAEELEVSLRTLYRDMAELQAQGVPILGEAGIGYELRAGYSLPPLMLTENEVEAAVLGARYVLTRGDAELRRGARDLLSKLESVLPHGRASQIADSALRVPPRKKRDDGGAYEPAIRRALREHRKLRIGSRAADAGPISERTVWPVLLGYFDTVQVMAAWCELRHDFRHFRTDRVQSLDVLEAPIPENAGVLRLRWQAADVARGDDK